MPKANQLITKAEKSVLEFLYYFQPCEKSLLRLVGNNYDYYGRVVASLFQKKFITYIKIVPFKNFKEEPIVLTKSGTETIELFVSVSNDFKTKLYNRIKGDENKYRQLKLSSVILMLKNICPSYTSQYCSLEKTLSNNSVLFSQEVTNRISGHKNNIAFISCREIRDMDEFNLRKITATRASGVLYSFDKSFVLFNHNRKRMKSHGDFEDKFKTHLELNMPNQKISAIHFSRSYGTAINSIYKTSIKQRGQYIITKEVYDNNYFVPLTSTGAKQLKIYLIPDFRKKVRSQILLSKEIDKAKNTIYDGESENGDIIYLGFECNLSEIEKLFYILETTKRNSNIKIYCFNHQKQFYKDIFKGAAEVFPLSVDEVLESIN